MNAGFRAVQWNRHKLIYDGVLLAGIALYITTFLAASRRWQPTEHPVTWDILRIRAFGTCAFLLLTMILMIGPLARLDRRFLPLLYNRRHFGVVTFCVAALHGWYVLGWYHSDGKLPMLVSMLASNPHYDSFIYFPYETLGVVSLIVLFLMAATSHDFWLAVLTPPVWKALHMAVYVVYGLLVMHVALGAMQTERHPLVPVLLGGAFAAVAVLHLAAGWRDRLADRGARADRDVWLPVGPPGAIPDRCARIVVAPSGERIAVFRHGSLIGALTNVCGHQNGPLGEGRIIDGCVTCPWHGFQYRLNDGCAPPPFTDKVATYRVRIRQGVVEIDPRALPPGTQVTLADTSLDGIAGGTDD